MEASQVSLSTVARRKIALDIGGTLAKVCYVVPRRLAAQPSPTAPQSSPLLDPVVDPLPFSADSEPYELRFCYFHSRNPQLLVDFIREQGLIPEDRQLRVTGGGAYRLNELLEKELDAQVVRVEEMAAAMAGLSLAMRRPRCTFYYNLTADAKQERLFTTNRLYPYMLVNIGSGISILKCSRPGEFTRISGTCIGGGTALGLAKLCFGAESFAEVERLSKEGTDSLDLNVADLIGDSAGSRVLPPDALASSFGRLGQLAQDPSELPKADIARSAVKMVSYNIGYLALLLAKINNVSRIYFAGKYISDHSFAMKTITQAVEFYSYYGQQSTSSDRDPSDVEWGAEPAVDNSSFDTLTASLQLRSLSRVERESHQQRHEALFIRHDGYLGALGALTS